MSWFLKYRPKTIGELHLESVRSELQSLLKASTFPQALLFAGPKGTGKTSSARIIGAILNDPANAETVETLFFQKQKPKKPLLEPNTSLSLVERIETGNSFTVNEMDAASHRGIDDIRQLRERLALPPQEGKMAVYILDEVHMLTTEAFNALLKVLEEPPPHVVFILATTELHKVPATISSRCRLIQFRQATPEELTAAIETVLKQEKITAEPAAIALVAQRAEGSFRDAIKFLESLAGAGKKITVADVTAQNLQSYQDDIETLIEAVLAKDESKVAQQFQALRAQQVDSQYFYNSLLSYLHLQLMIAIGVTTGKAVAATKVVHFLLDELSRVEVAKSSSLPLLTLELKLLELIFRSKDKNNSGGSIKKQKVEAPVASENEAISVTAHSHVVPLMTSTTPDSLVETSSIQRDSIGDGEKLVTGWDQFLQILHDKNISLELLLRSAKPLEGSTGKLKIQVYYSFHKEQLQQPKFLKILQECMAPLSGGYLQVEFVVAQRQETVETMNIQPVADNSLVELAQEILS